MAFFERLVHLLLDPLENKLCKRLHVDCPVYGIQKFSNFFPEIRAQIPVGLLPRHLPIHIFIDVAELIDLEGNCKI